MAARKVKKTRALLEGDTVSGPGAANFVVTSIPDFDEVQALETFNQFDALSRGLIRHLASIQMSCDEGRRIGLLRTLSCSDHAARLAGTLGEVEKALQACAHSLLPLRTAFEAWTAGERRSRRVRFEKLASTMGWKVIGNWPEPVIDGIVFVAVDESRNRATINGRAVEFPTAERLGLQVSLHLADIVANRASPQDFVIALWQAYQASGGQLGQGVLVFDLVAELTWLRQTKAFQRDPRQDLYRGYSAAQFRADLTHYLASGAPLLEDAGKRYKLDVVGGSFAEEGIFMYFPQTDQLATCGRLTFRSIDRDEHR